MSPKKASKKGKAKTERNPPEKTTADGSLPLLYESSKSGGGENEEKSEDNTGGGREGGDLDSDRFAPPRIEVAKMATQLVAAQIVATSYAAGANHIVVAVQKIVAEYLRGLDALMDAPSATKRFRPYKERQRMHVAISALREAARIAEVAPIAKPLNYPVHDALFEGAITRAQQLLREPVDQPEIVHAEQLFSPDENLTGNCIGKRFTSASWPPFPSNKGIHAMLREIEKWFCNHLDQMISPDNDPLLQSDAELMQAVLEMEKRRMLETEDLLDLLRQMIRKEPHSKLGRAEAMMEAARKKHLVDLAFVGKGPLPTPPGRGVARNYRPWVLFRFLRQTAYTDDDARDLYSNFMTGEPLDVAVDPLYAPVIGDYGPLERIVEQMVVADQAADHIRWVTRAATGSVTLAGNITKVPDLPEIIDEKFQDKVLETCRGGKRFDPVWPGIIKDGLEKLLLSGPPQPLLLIVDFMKNFYLPLLAAYGVLTKVAEDVLVSESGLLDLLPPGWEVVPPHRLKSESAAPIGEDSPATFVIKSPRGDSKKVSVVC